MTQQKFSWRKRGNSFGFAIQGLKALFRTEHNAWIHGGLTVVAVLLSLLLQITKIEFLILLLAMTLVWVTEILNTALEKTMDFISTEKHPQIKLVKDLAAAAVLITAIAALTAGVIIFLPKILYYAKVFSK